MNRIRLFSLLLAVSLLAAACGGNTAGLGLPDGNSGSFQLAVEDAEGNPLPRESAQLAVNGSTVEIHAVDSRAAGFLLSYDGANLHPATVQRGSYYSAADLFLAVESVSGLLAIGGRHLEPRSVPTPLRPQLVARVSFAAGAAGRALSAVPTAENATPRNFSYLDVGDGTATLSWDYHNRGDYDQNSEVGLSDISPIAVYFQAQSGDANWNLARVADGDENGEVNTADLTSIALNFQSTVTGCKIEESAAAAGPWTELADVQTIDSIAGPPRQFEYNLAPQSGFYYRVRAYSAEDDSQGPATDPLQITLLPLGDNPVAVAGSDVTSGDPPLTVNFFDDGSFDNDGTIEKWEWDLDGDLAYETDATGTAGATQHTYTTFGTYNVRLRVTDNVGRTGVDSLTINVSNPDPGDIPVARAWAMPDFGWAPLTVYTSALFSADPDGTITAWEWDMDANGSYETDATGTGGYAQTTINTPGEHTLTLRVTDNDANVSFATVNVTVFDPAASSVDYWDVFDDTQVRRINLTVSQANWDAMWADVEAELEVEADAVIFGDDLPQVGLRMKGNSSLNGTGLKKSWKIDTNDVIAGQEFRNTKMVILNNNFKDASMVREILAYDMLRFAGVPASFATFAEVWITVGAEAPELWGVYTFVERVDKKFLENRFIDDLDNLYKCEQPADLTWHGNDINNYPTTPAGEICYSKETNNAEGNYADLLELINIVDNQSFGSDSAFMAALEGVFDVDDFLRYQAVTKLHSNADVYSYMSQNYYLYHNPLTGKFQWLPWDLNEAWGQFGVPVENENHPLYTRGSFGGPGPGGPREAPLFEKVFAVREYRETYAAYVDLLLHNYFTRAQVETRALAYRNLIAPYVDQGAGVVDKMDYPYTQFENNFTQNVPGVPGSPPVAFPCLGLGSFTETRETFAAANLLPVP